MSEQLSGVHSIPYGVYSDGSASGADETEDTITYFGHVTTLNELFNL